MSRRMILTAASIFVFSLAFTSILAGTAAAQVVGPCQATIAGRDANSASTPQTAVEVEEDAVIVIQVSGPNKFTSHKVALEFAGVQWVVDEQTDDENTWTNNIEVSKYAKYGVGLYKVIGISSGNPCTGAAYVKVGGKNPLTTAAGAAAAGMTVVGGALAAASAVRAARRRGKAATEFAQLQFSQDSGMPSMEQLHDDMIRRVAERDARNERDWEEGSGCFLALPMTLVQTMAMMVSGMGAPGAPVATAARKAGFKPMVSVSGVIGALLAGLGTLVLAQEFAVVYPTRTVTIIWMIGAIVIEVLLTTLAGRSGAKKVLRAFGVAPTEQSPEQPEAEA